MNERQTLRIIFTREPAEPARVESTSITFAKKVMGQIGPKVTVLRQRSDGSKARVAHGGKLCLS